MYVLYYLKEKSFTGVQVVKFDAPLLEFAFSVGMGLDTWNNFYNSILTINQFIISFGMN